MSNTPNETQAKMSWDLAKLMLMKYNILHSFHEEQLKYYAHLCTKYAFPSSFSVNLDTKEVTFNMKRKENYKLKGNRYIPRAKYSPFALYFKFMLNRDELAMRKRLKLWTRNLLWADTKITIVYI